MTTNAGEAAAFIRLEQTKCVLHPFLSRLLRPPLPYHQPVRSRRNLWNTKQNHLPEPVPDSTSGSGAPDIEIIAAPLTYSKHGSVSAPPGTQSFTMVSNFIP